MDVGRSEAQDDSFEFHARLAEVEQETNAQSGRLQVVHALR
jgi:hypothetical protein